MTKVRINYSTAYDTTNKICGYVIAEDCGNYYTISKKQYDRALKKRTIGGIAGIIFHCDKEVFLTTADGQIIF